MTKHVIRFLALALVLSTLPLSGCNGITDILPVQTITAAPPAATTSATEGNPTTPATAPDTTATQEATPSPLADATGDASALPDVTADTSATPDATATATETAAASPTPTATESATPSPTPTPTETAAASPTPAPLPTSSLGDRPDVQVIQYYGTLLPDGLTLNLLYNKYETFNDYFVLLRSSKVRELPNAKAKSLLSVGSARRLKMLAQVKGTDGKSIWYRVQIDATTVGYLPENVGSPRTFQFQQALDRARTMKAEADSGMTLYVNNYKNKMGVAPAQADGKSVDALGYRRDQSAPGYLSADGTGDIRYLPDGTMLQWIQDVGDFKQVKEAYSGQTYYVPKKYLNQKGDHIGSLTQVVIVDRKNQNTIVMQYADGGWQVVSLSFVSTGKNKGTSLPTPLGAYVTLGKAPRFFYTETIDKKKMYAGFAPYAVRFSCGAWLHGVPHDVTPMENWEDIPIPKTLHEANSTLGTTPQSHMCVRNYTSHAQFLYGWIKIGSSAVAVIE